MSKKIVELNLDRFLARNNIKIGPVTRVLLETVLSADEVLAMHRYPGRTKLIFKLAEQFVRERGGDVVHENIIEASRTWKEGS